MLIRLSSAFDRMDYDNLEPFAGIIENLIYCHRQGNHVFFPGQRVLEWIIDQHNIFSQSQRSSALEIKESAPFYQGIIKDAAFVVLIVPAGAPLVAERENDFALLHINRFSNSTVLERGKILVENAETDGAFFRALCECLARSAGFARVPSIEFMHGGGSTIGPEYERVANGNRPVVCIVDSDRCSPKAPLGDTAEAIRKIQGTEVNPLATSWVLDVREAENFIPLEVTRDLYLNNPHVQNVITKLECFKTHDEKSKSEDRFIRWFDMKNGFRRSYFKQPKCAGSQNYLREMWSILDPHEKDFDIDTASGSDIICGGISANLLEAFAQHAKIPRNRVRIHAEMRRGGFYGELSELVAFLLAFTAHPAISRV